VSTLAGTLVRGVVLILARSVESIRRGLIRGGGARGGGLRGGGLRRPRRRRATDVAAAAALAGLKDGGVLIRHIFIARGRRGWTERRRPRHLVRCIGKIPWRTSSRWKKAPLFMDAMVSLSRFLSNCLPCPDFSISYLLKFDRLEVVATLSGFII
jgi:hypothetical protein